MKAMKGWLAFAGAMAWMMGTMPAVWAEGSPAITLHRVQQRYPWNGMVDIDYTVANVPAGQESEYYVRFVLTENGRSHILHDFLDDAVLVDAQNGKHRVTWNSAAEEPDYHFFARSAKMEAELIYCGDDKSNSPYGGERFLIIDLSLGTTATAGNPYPVVVRRLPTQEAANTLFNTSEYKTTKLVLRYVRPGSFLMGSPEGEAGRNQPQYYNLETQHQVTFTKGYYLGIFPVTQHQYELVMGAHTCRYTSPSTGNPVEERPVEQVSYEDVRGSVEGVKCPATFGQVDADSFSGRLRTRTGITFDLPTEAQWEYACRAGTTTMNYAGDFNSSTVLSVVGNYAWYGANSGSTTHAVGQKLPNPWGFYDVHGNLWEWCRDRVAAPTGDDPGTEAVTDPLRNTGTNVPSRGGNWYSTIGVSTFQELRAACRNGSITSTSHSDNSYGFRISCVYP